MKTALQQQNESETDDSNEEENWKKLAKSKTEVAYVIGAAQADQDADDVSVDSTTAKKYLKCYRKSKKRRKF